MRTLSLAVFPIGLLAAGCASMPFAGGRQALPVSPHLAYLDAGSVFARAPQAEWHQPVLDDAANASLDVRCGVGPLLQEGTLYAAVSLTGRPPRAQVAPLNVSLVLDRSGSMHGKPFSNMLLAAEAFVGQFRDGDRLSVVVFSDSMFEAVPPIVLSPQTRGQAIASVRSLIDGGATNISGGVLAGLHELFSFWNEWQVNQVVLFSDGQPTTGITSPEQLAGLAARAAAHGVGVTTIGFGLDHDELLMQGIADAGGGNYYYVDSPDDMAAIFQREATAMLRAAARGTTVSLNIPAGLLVDDVIGYDYYMGGNQLWIRVGAVAHQEERYVVIRFRPQAGASASLLPIGLSYADMARRGHFGVNCRPTFRMDRGGPDKWVLELAGRAEAGWGLAEAMGWADQGSEIFVINQIGHTRGVIASLRTHLGQGALTVEDQMLEGAQVRLGMNVASGAAAAGWRGGVSGLLRFGTQQAVSNTTTAAVAGTTAAFRPLVRAAVQTAWYGQPVGFYSARTQRSFRRHDDTRNRRYKQARYDAYVQVRVRSHGP